MVDVPVTLESDVGVAMQERVKRYYDLNLVDDAYATIYRHHRDAPAQAVA